ncbi:MAG: hypothetical protein D8H99_44960 [Streptococcus sp.]|nr:MAG: hypothetical protein D8H99_44960 [Streptococcus sp.]
MITFKHKKKLLHNRQILQQLLSSIYKLIVTKFYQKVKLQKRNQKQKTGAAIVFTASFCAKKRGQQAFS